jgi:flagellar L-ring protein FlgH
MLPATLGLSCVLALSVAAEQTTTRTNDADAPASPAETAPPERPQPTTPTGDDQSQANPTAPGVHALAGPAHSAAPTSSLLAGARPAPLRDANGRVRPDHALRQTSMFAVQPPEPRMFREHDLVQIIIRETSKATSSQETEAKKDYSLDIGIPDWPAFQLQDLLQFQLQAGSTTDDPKVKVESNKEFKGEGDYERKDDLTARLTAEVIEVLPNGNLILEARTFIKTDGEEATLKVTGICRPEDVTAANTVQSQQIHDLKVEKMHKGQLKDASKKGLIAKVLDTVFAF